MKIASLLLLVLLSCNSICVDSYNNKGHDEEKEYDKFIKVMKFQAAQLHYLAKECNVEHNKDSCNEIQTIKKKLKEGTRIHGQRPFFEYYVILLHDACSFNRKELYEQDVNVLEKYKKFLPEELYSLLSDYEEESALIRNECVLKHNMQVCKKTFDRSMINREIFDNLT